MSSASATFEEFVAARGDALKRLAHLTLGEASLAEDATQSALAEVFRRWETIENPNAYARRAVVTACIDRQRKAGRELPTAPADLPANDVASAVADRSALSNALWQVVNTLPPRQRAILVLRYYEDLSDQEIAEVLGISRGTVRSSIHRALETLRTHHKETLT